MASFKYQLKDVLKKAIASVPPLEYLIRLIVLHIYVRQAFREKECPASQGFKVLIVNHHFEQDIDAIIEANESHAAKVVDHRRLFGISNCFFTREERDGVVPYDKVNPERKNAYGRIAKRIIALVRQRFPFDVMVLPSDSFFWIREVIFELRAMGIPTVIIDKEGTISPYFFKRHPAEIKEKFPFISDKLMVWSERQKEFWTNSGVDRGIIQVVGQPRSDFFFAKSKWLTREQLGLPHDRKIVLFFTYELDAYIPAQLYGSELNWKEVREGTHRVLNKLSMAFPGVQFLIKAHPQQRDISAIIDAFAGCRKNLTVLTGSQLSNQLLVNADIIVGFQTTALIEAMLLRKPILYTFWSKPVADFAEELIPFHKSGALDLVASESDLEEKLRLYIENAFELSVHEHHSRKKFLEVYFKEANGLTGERIWLALEAFMAGR
jgi:hypothetical protein